MLTHRGALERRSADDDGGRRCCDDDEGFGAPRAQARWYDLLAAALTLGRERQLRERLVSLARLAPGESVIDVGCGTGTLALAAKGAVGARGSAVGVDASPEMIALATAKASRAGAAVTFRMAVAERLPFADRTFDALLATLMLHHLPAPVRRTFMREALRVLRPGGRVLAVDFAAPSGRRGGMLSRLHRHGGVPLDAMVALLRDAGFRIREMGSVGVSDLQYVVAESPCEGELVDPGDARITSRTLPPLPVPRWILPAIGIVVLGAHLVVARQLVTRLTLSAAGLAVAGVVAIVLAMHLPRRR